MKNIVLVVGVAMICAMVILGSLGMWDILEKVMAISVTSLCVLSLYEDLRGK